jgi:hypothetical protein
MFFYFFLQTFCPFSKYLRVVYDEHTNLPILRCNCITNQPQQDCFAKEFGQFHFQNSPNTLFKIEFPYVGTKTRVATKL